MKTKLNHSDIIFLIEKRYKKRDSSKINLSHSNINMIVKRLDAIKNPKITDLDNIIIEIHKNDISINNYFEPSKSLLDAIDSEAQKSETPRGGGGGGGGGGGNKQQSPSNFINYEANLKAEESQKSDNNFMESAKRKPMYRFLDFIEKFFKSLFKSNKS